MNKFQRKILNSLFGIGDLEEEKSKRRLSPRMKIPFRIMIACATVFIVNSYGNGYFGWFVNKLFPCVQIQINSIPCYASYDIKLSFVLFGVFIISALGIAGIYIWEKFAIRNPQ